MGDGLKLSKDKRHRSTSSIAGIMIDGTRSERKLDVKASIPEMEDHFAIAESRCDDLQEKIDYVKALKMKRKLKKRSMTRVNEQPPVEENVPFISVRTQPKKKMSHQAARMRRLDIPPNPTRGYLDPATVEQHHMIGQVHGYNQAFKQPQQPDKSMNKPTYTGVKTTNKPRLRRLRADGDGMYKNILKAVEDPPMEVACGNDDVMTYSDNDDELYRIPEPAIPVATKKRVVPDVRHQVKGPLQANRRRHVPRDVPAPEDNAAKAVDTREGRRGNVSPNIQLRRRLSANQKQQQQQNNVPLKEERQVVELFNKSRSSNSPDSRSPEKQRSPRERKKKEVDNQNYGDITGHLENTDSKKQKDTNRQPRRVKYRSRRYEMPTIASQMKQAGIRYYYGTSNHTNIPFVVTKSTAPSHNIGVNIQQVLNGLKIQQPLSGIPSTIAHHMGLGHIAFAGTKNVPLPPVALDNREINAIRVGRRLLRLPSYKYVSYNRLLSLYREGDGMVPRFLRAISRPHYFYTSMYNLATNRREDVDAATSKGRVGSQEAKQSLQEYAKLYREYESIDRAIRDGHCDSEWEKRRDELSRELTAREEQIRRVVQECRPDAEFNIRASASNAEENYRQSTFKLNSGDQ